MVTDFPGFKYKEYDCSFFRDFEETHYIPEQSMCKTYGVVVGSGGLSVNEACCYCGGKINKNYSDLMDE